MTVPSRGRRAHLRARGIAAIAALAMLVSVPLAADENGEDDSGTGTSDAPRARFLPIPIFITEPAIGNGLGVALAYFHKPKDGEAGESPSAPALMTPGSTTDEVRDKQRPPTVTGLAAAYTENGTWGIGLGHANTWRDDRIRYSGSVGYVNVLSRLYRFDFGIDFDIKGVLVSQDVRVRIAGSDFFLGAKLSYLGADATIRLDLDQPRELGEGDIGDSGIAAQAVWDTRDNVLTPGRGQRVQLEAWRFDRSLGGDFDYWKAVLKVHSFHPIGERIVLAWRIEARTVDGDPPFWGYPWVTLRGVPALRYQNERAGVAEIELRYDPFERWGVLAFFGKGATGGNDPAFDTEDDIRAGGVGGRFLFDTARSLWVGLDVARGPEATYGYIQVGHAW